MDIYGNKLMNTIATKPLCISLPGERMDPIDFGGQGHN